MMNQITRKHLKELSYTTVVDEIENYAIILLDRDGNIEDWNKGARKIKGYSAEEIIGRNFRVFYTKEDIANNLPGLLLQQAFVNGFAKNEGWRVKKNGTLFWADVTINAIYDENREVMGFVKITHDLTLKKKSEEIEKNFLTAIDKIGDNVWEHDFRTGKTFFSDNIYEVIGYKKDELTNNADLWWSRTHEDDKWMLIESDRKYKEGTQTSHSLEYRVFHKDGSLQWVRDRGVVIESNDDGKPLRIIGTHTKITDIKEAEEKVRQIQLQFQAFMEHMPAMTWIVDRECRYRFTNKLYCQTFYDGNTKLEGKSFFELFPADVAKHFKANNEIVFNTNKFLETTESAFRNDGTKLIMKVFKFPLEISKEVTMLGGIAVDITEILSTQENLEKLNEKLVASNNELEQFAYITSHDLQEPLNTITGFTKLLEKQLQGRLDNKQEMFMKFIIDSSKRMSTLIKSLLDYSRLGKSTEITDVDCNKLLQTVIDDLAGTITIAEAKINADELPVIKGYKTELRVLFQNLISNAIKFRKKNETPAINISVTNHSNEWIFSINDNGIGIDMKYKERIFQIFQRLNAREEYEGEGIGLAHCKKIIELHKGNIWIESFVDVGTTVYFSIPKTKDLNAKNQRT